MQPPPNLKVKIQFYCGDEIAMGPGKADLLEAIRAHGSIAAAGRAMAMSYRRAWLLVDAMNRCWAQPLVQAAPEGTARSGARLTALGEEVLARYRALQDRAISASAGEDLSVLEQSLRRSPRERQGE